jgi:Ca2+-transporting ATPase
VQVICLDKTGTLTQNRMAVIALHTSGQRLELHGDVLRPAAGPPTPTAPSDVRRLLEIGCLCSDSSVNGSGGTETLDGSATENALVQAALTLGVEPTALRAQWPRMRARYRAEGRNHMATLHQGNGTRVVAVKGSPAEVLAMCTQRLQDAAVVPLTAEDREAILRENELMGGAALRVLGFAYREDPGLTEPEPACLTWVGLAGLADPVREGVPELIRVLHGAGIRTLMITGDQSGTAYAIGRQLGLSGTDRLEILDAGNLDSLEPDVLAALAGKVHVFSRVSPAHKLAIVQALQRAGNVVAMTGDGINDGPALKAADIGIAMGASGTQVARDVAGMVIEDDELGTLTTAVREGRSIYGNIRKSIHYLASTNLSEVAIMMVGVAGGLGEPLNTMQLLWLNLLSDVLPALALAADPADSRVLEHPPRDPRAPIIGRDQLLRFGVECAALSAGTLGAYGYAVGRYGQGPRASTVALATLTFAQMLHACGCRSDERTLLRPAARPPNR